MSEQNSVTNVDDVAVPVSVVELEHLKTKTGEKVRVRCEQPDELVLQRIFLALPGARPVASDDDAAISDQEKIERVARYAPVLIESATVLESPDGEVRPAFYFGAVKPHPKSIPGRVLRLSDLVKLAEEVSRLSGYLGGEAEAASFPDGERAGVDDSPGTGPAGDEVRPDAVASPA
jgi:hypothetical protein